MRKDKSNHQIVRIRLYVDGSFWQMVKWEAAEGLKSLGFGVDVAGWLYHTEFLPDTLDKVNKLIDELNRKHKGKAVIKRASFMSLDNR